MEHLAIFGLFFLSDNDLYNTYLILIALGDPIVKPAKSCHPGDLSLMNAEGEVLTADSRHFSGQDLKVSVWFQTPITGIAGIPPWKTGLQW